MIANVRFVSYSTLSKQERDKTNYIKIKRLVLRIEQDQNLKDLFDYRFTYSLSHFALKYFDLESEVWNCFHYKDFDGSIENRNYTDSLSNFLLSLYEEDRAYFQTFVGFVINE